MKRLIENKFKVQGGVKIKLMNKNINNNDVARRLVKAEKGEKKRMSEFLWLS